MCVCVCPACDGARKSWQENKHTCCVRQNGSLIVCGSQNRFPQIEKNTEGTCLLTGRTKQTQQCHLVVILRHKSHEKTYCTRPRRGGVNETLMQLPGCWASKGQCAVIMSRETVNQQDGSSTEITRCKWGLPRTSWGMINPSVHGD